MNSIRDHLKVAFCDQYLWPPTAGSTGPGAPGHREGVAPTGAARQMIADLPVPDEHLVGAPVLPDQNTPGQMRATSPPGPNTWRSARDAGQAPAR